MKTTHFKSVAEWMAFHGHTDQSAADLLGLDRTEVLRLRRGKKYRSLRTPLRVSRMTRVPIENLAATDAA